MVGPANDQGHRIVAGDLHLEKSGWPTIPVQRLGTPVMACDFWGESPLYEKEDLKVGRIPTVTPIDQVLDEGNCGEATNRGEEACECAVKLTTDRTDRAFIGNDAGVQRKSVEVIVLFRRNPASTGRTEP